MSLRPYTMGGAPPGAVRLHLNEYRGDHPDAVASLSGAGVGAGWLADSILREYPDGRAIAALEADLAEFLGVPPACVVASAGSDEALRAAVEMCALRCGRGREPTAVVGVPTYTHFLQFARLRGFAVVEYPLGELPAATLAGFADELSRDGSVVYLGNPNNPLGGVLDAGAVAAAAAAHPRAVFIVDEAYVEYASVRACGNLNACSLAPLAAAAPNVVVTRTFSKAFGLAGLRVGYAVASPAVVAELRVVLSPKAVGALPAAVARAALAHAGHYAGEAARAVARTAAFVEWLRSEGWRVTESPGNFFLVHAGDAPALVAALQRRGIYVRDRSDQPSLVGCVRVSAGSEADFDALYRAFRGAAIEPPAPAATT